MISEVITCFLTQIIFTIGAIILFGLLIALCNKLFYKNMGGFGKAACYITGFLGTPVHECSHALMCLIFGHKITEIKLFQINSQDGTLGYVNHSYNTKNLYQKIGNFFIGIAPIIVISGVLYLLSILLVPNMLELILGQTKDIRLDEGIIGVLDDMLFTIRIFFSYASTLNWWIFLLIGMFLSLHMTLSTADIKGAWSGLLLLLLVVLGIDIVFAIVDIEILSTFTRWCLSVGSYLSSVLILSLTVSIFAVILSYLFKVLLKKKFS
ncbi:MAG: DUF3267 domain-containing protein [Clostridia bacterium]|nr:DUF3267 domain-containing protein [Clostridia bacterium]